MQDRMHEKEKTPCFSVVCIFNKPDVLQKDLLDSLEQQNFTDYELIALDTKAEGFDRASGALNEACGRAAGRYLVIAHQDMILKKEDTLSWLLKECQIAFVEQNYGLLGAAGGLEGERNYSSMDTKAEQPQVIPCMTVDECVLVLPRELWKTHKFEDLGQTWHAYGVDLSMQLRRDGYQVGVFHAPMWHDYGGTSKGGQGTDLNYFQTMARLTWKYRKDTSVIATSCGHWPTGLRYVKVLKKRLPGAIRSEVKKKHPALWTALAKIARKHKG